MATETQEGENKALVRRSFEELDAHDLDVVDELLAEEYTTGIYRSGSDETLGGRDGMTELWGSTGRRWRSRISRAKRRR